MPQINIDNSRLDLNTENYRTLTELLPSIKDNYLPEGQNLISININGTSQNIIQNDMMLNLPLKDITSIDFITTNNKSVILEAIDSFPKYIDSLINKVNLTVKFYEKKQDQLGDTTLEDIVGTIDLFIQLVTQIHKSLSVESDRKLSTGTTIKQLEIHLLSVIKAVLSARKHNDIVMLIDLLDYELRDNLTQWKIAAIPQIKKINTI